MELGASMLMLLFDEVPGLTRSHGRQREKNKWMELDFSCSWIRTKTKILTTGQLMWPVEWCIPVHLAGYQRQLVVWRINLAEREIAVWVKLSGGALYWNYFNSPEVWSSNASCLDHFLHDSSCCCSGNCTDSFLSSVFQVTWLKSNP